MSLTTLLPVEERLFEAEYFGGRLRFLANPEFRYELHAYLSAARNVTFVLQKEMKDVPGFKVWWNGYRERMGRDGAMRFFVELRNRSQKKGDVRFVGGSRRLPDGRHLWSYRFVKSESQVPDSLIHRDVVDCCLEHLAKLAAILLEFNESFRFYSCYRHAISREGMDALGTDVPDVLKFLGHGDFAAESSAADRDETLRWLRQQVDGVDFQAIERLAGYRPIEVTDPETPSDQLSEALVHKLVNSFSSTQE